MSSRWSNGYRGWYLITRHVTSIIDVETVLYDPEIRIKASVRDELPDLSGLTLIGCYLNYKIISLFIEHKGKGHFYCLKPYRKYAREAFKASLELSPDVYFEVPTRALENFARKCGFIKSGNRMVIHG